MPNAGRLAKDVMVRELTTQLKARPNFFVAGVGRLSATDADTLRKRLQAMQGRMLMVKRTLGLQGLAALKIDGGLTRMLEGSVAFVFPGEDLIPAAKLLADFAKQEQDKLSIRGGLVDGHLLDRRQFDELAGLPPKPHLMAQLIGVLESPLADVVFTLERLLGDVAWILEEASKQKEEPHG
jgi:large subunit ribosomal protein L10